MTNAMTRMVSCVGVVLLMMAGEACAHGFGQRYDLPLPLWLYLWGAGAAVAVSFVFLAFFRREFG